MGVSLRPYSRIDYGSRRHFTCLVGYGLGHRGDGQLLFYNQQRREFQELHIIVSLSPSKDLLALTGVSDLTSINYMTVLIVCQHAFAALFQNKSEPYLCYLQCQLISSLVISIALILNSLDIRELQNTERNVWGVSCFLYVDNRNYLLKTLIIMSLRE